MSGVSTANPSHHLTDAHSDPVPQFFIALDNDSQHVLTLLAVHSTLACGWVREPCVGESIAAGAERIWCGMPWDMASPIALRLEIAIAGGGQLMIALQRSEHQAATCTVQLDDAPHLQVQTELQRADSTSPFVLLTLKPR